MSCLIAVFRVKNSGSQPKLKKYFSVPFPIILFAANCDNFFFKFQIFVRLQVFMKVKIQKKI